MTREMRRSLEDVLDLWPDEGMVGPDSLGQRGHAIYEVLTTLPNETYSRLAELVDNFTWFVPDAETRGMVHPFFANVKEALIEQPVDFSKVLYLSPQLEHDDFDIAVATVAHELAHIILGHPVVYRNEESYDERESEAWVAVRKWGFEEEADARDKMRQQVQDR